MMVSGEILVVDDMAENLELVSQILEDAGYDVATVLRGDHALELVQNHPPDLILLDVIMPGIDGFEVCQQLEATLDRTIPVIFMTALNDTDSKVKGLDVGAVDYITKPFQEKELLARVKTHLNLHRYEQRLEHLVKERTLKLKTALDQLEQSQLQLVQSAKMSAMGNLVAGVAHEVNNPLSCISGNIAALKEALQDIIEYLKLYEKTFPAPGDKIVKRRDVLEIDFLLQDLPQIFASMETGCQRIYDISTSLRTFSRTDAESKFKVNIHEGLESILLILKYRLKANSLRSPIEVIRDYGELPEISCFPNQLSQAFMNILANAIDMFDEMAEGELMDGPQNFSGQITIQTRPVDSQHVEICIGDNGKGMSKEVCSRIFDRTFSTKAAGKGTGLGLAITQQIVVEKHHGSLEVYSELGQGSRFIIQLPIES